MKNILLLLAGIGIGVGITMLPLSCNPGKKFAPSSSSRIYSIDDPEKDSFISYRDADTMQQHYLADSRRFPFRYHEPGHLSHTVDAILNGVMVKKASLDSLFKLTGCDKYYLMYGINFQKRGGSSITDTLLTTVIVPILTDPHTTHVYHIAANRMKTAGDTLTLEYNNPCPPYCPN